MDALTDQTKADIHAHTLDCRPYECCGVIISTANGPAVRRCGNEASEPAVRFRMRGADVRAAEDEGEIIAAYHSHVYEPPLFSDGDRRTAENNQIPMIVFSWPNETWGYYQPCGWEAPLLGRPFVQGVLDCYTLIQDYFRQKLDITLPDFDRPDDWWTPQFDRARKEAGLQPLNPYIEHFEEGGFLKVEKEEMQEHDILLIQIRSDRPNHGAIYLGDGMIMHHLMGRLSCRHPYTIDRGEYALNTQAVIRHKSLFQRPATVNSP